MKTAKRIVGSLILIMLTFGCVTCASSPKKSSIGEYVDDSVITTKVKSRLAADDFLKALQIGVETFKGTVQLSGFVGYQKDADKAVELASSVEGVKSIVNSLVIK